MFRRKTAFFISAFLMTAVVLTSVTAGIVLTGCQPTGGNRKTKLVLNEVAHSIFYAPMYVALENGYFEDENLDVTLVNGKGADHVMTAVLAGEAQIGFMGSESSVYVYKEGAKDYIVNFSQLTQKAGNFLVGRTKETDFSWDKLKGKTVLGGREGGMPEMVFEYILKQNNISIEKDLNIVKNIDFGLTAQAFSAGQGDYTVEFEPFAAGLEEEGKGVVLASLGEASGSVPYTAFSAKKSYLENNPEAIQAFVNAIQKGLEFVREHEPAEIAEVIQPQFQETKREKIITIVTRYKNQDTWKENQIFEKDSFDLLQKILTEGGVLKGNVPYDKLIDTRFAKKAVEADSAVK